MRSRQPSSGKQEASTWLGGFELVEEPDWDDRLVLVARGELDVGSVGPLRERLDAGVSSGVARILLDFAAVSFIESLSLAAIVAAKRRMGHEGRLAVVSDHPYVRLILEAGGLDSFLEVFGDREAAEAYLTA